MNEVEEVWQPIPGYEGLFEASNLGHIRSNSYCIIQRNGRQRTFYSRMICPTPRKKGHYKPVVNLHQMFYSVEWLVATTFIDNPNNLTKVGHYNKDLQDNRASNLYWKEKDEISLSKDQRVDFSKDKVLQSQYEVVVTPCDVCDTEVEMRPGALNGKLRKNRSGVYCSLKCASRSVSADEHKERGRKMRGKNSHSWKGGPKTDQAFRRSSAYRDWSNAVLKRDNYTCFFCGCRGGPLQADHIKTFASHPELQLDVTNGRAVCKQCHEKTPTYGGRGRLSIKIKNKTAKRRIVELSFKYKLSHLGSNLSAIDIILKMLKKKREGDRFFLSAGHYGLAYYVALETLCGHDAEQLFLKHGTHCAKDIESKIWCVNGSLGCVVSIAMGAALADRSRDIYCLLSDGELAEGSTSEAIRFKANHKLDNLKIFVNANGLGAYSVIDVERAMKETLSVARDVQFCYTTPNQLPFLSGIDAHYHVMSETDYQIAMEILK